MYFILVGRVSKVHLYHFVFLNHFHYKKIISFNFFLENYLLSRLKAHKQKASRTIIHEGLILLIIEFFHDSTPNHSIPISTSKRKREEEGLPSRKEIVGDSSLKNKSSC